MVLTITDCWYGDVLDRIRVETVDQAEYDLDRWLDVYGWERDDVNISLVTEEGEESL